MLSFLPNFGRMPVSAEQNVSVILQDDSFFEGPAKDFEWEGKGPNVVEGWREMLPGEVLHSEHRLPHRRTRILKRAYK